MPSWPSFLSAWLLFSPPDEKAMIFTPHLSWMDFRFLLSFICLCLFSSLSPCVCQWFMKWTKFMTVRGGVWRGEASSCSRMTRLVRCMCARSLKSNIKCYRSSSFHIFRWLLHIIHSSQLLFQASWLTQLPSRFWIGVNSQWFLSVLACSTW